MAPGTGEAAPALPETQTRQARPGVPDGGLLGCRRDGHSSCSPSQCNAHGSRHNPLCQTCLPQVLALKLHNLEVHSFHAFAVAAYDRIGRACPVSAQCPPRDRPASALRPPCLRPISALCPLFLCCVRPTPASIAPRSVSSVSACTRCVPTLFPLCSRFVSTLYPLCARYVSALCSLCIHPVSLCVRSRPACFAGRDDTGLKSIVDSDAPPFSAFRYSVVAVDEAQDLRPLLFAFVSKVVRERASPAAGVQG